MISNSAWNTSNNSKDDLAASSIPILDAGRKRHYEDLGKSSTSTLDYCQKRHRIPGKQAISSAIVDKRSLQSEHRLPRGHYDVLGISRAAAASDVRRAYRQMALKTHPDKGGKAEEFRSVFTAFEVLSDQSKLDCGTFCTTSTRSASRM